MSLDLHPIDNGHGFAAEVHRIDLARGIDALQTEAIEQALADYGVLAFRRQPLDDAQQQRFIACFGPPVVDPRGEPGSRWESSPQLGDAHAGGFAADHAPGMCLHTDRHWHTDGSQVQPPVRLTALSARQLPPSPPPTEFADMRAAWSALSPKVKACIDKLVVEHSIVYSRAKLGMNLADLSEAGRQCGHAVAHPLVRTHPRTGRKSLYLASHASHIVGRPVEEGRALIDELTVFATQRKFVYVHEWQPNDLVMWDDSWTMHRSTPHPEPQSPVMRWCGVRELAPV